MASEKDFEILDEYAGNRLNPQERAAFEKQLESDAELKNELSLQREIIEGIRSARKAELKQMLRDIPVSSIPGEGMSLAAKIGLWVVVAGLVGTGIYYFTSKDDTAPSQPAIANEIKEESTDNAVVEEPQASATDDAPTLSTDDPKVEQPAEQAPVQAQHKAEQQTAKTPAATNAPASEPIVEQESVEPSTLDVFDPSQDSETAEQAAADEIGPKISTKSSIAVETEVDKRYNFHYQFRDNKLFLYGSFDKNLYEIMEFNSANKRTVFLYYKDNYYLLNDADQKVKPLAPINDAALLKKLRDYRGN